MNVDLSPIMSGVVGGLIALAVGLIINKSNAASSASSEGPLRYHGFVTFFGYFCLGLLALMAFFGLRDWGASSSLDRLYWLVLITFFVFAPGYLLSLSTVRISYDDKGIAYRDLFRRIDLPWTEIRAVRYSKVSQMFTIQGATARIAFSSYLIGYLDLLQRCSDRSGVALPKQALP